MEGLLLHRCQCVTLSTEIMVWGRGGAAGKPRPRHTATHCTARGRGAGRAPRGVHACAGGRLGGGTPAQSVECDCDVTSSQSRCESRRVMRSHPSGRPIRGAISQGRARGSMATSTITPSRPVPIFSVEDRPLSLVKFHSPTRLESGQGGPHPPSHLKCSWLLSLKAPPSAMAKAGRQHAARPCPGRVKHSSRATRRPAAKRSKAS